MDNSLYRLLRYGNVLCMQFQNDQQRLYAMRGGIVYIVEDYRLHEAEEQLNKDFHDHKLKKIDMQIYFQFQKNKSFNVWNKTDGSFNWHSIFVNMKKLRKELGFTKTDFFKHKADVIPLKVLCAKAYRDHFGLEACLNMQYAMDYETQLAVLRKQVWWI